MSSWAAHYYDGISAGRQDVQVRVAPEGLWVQLPAGPVLWPYAQIRQTQGFYPGELVRLEFGSEPPAVMTVADRSILMVTERFAPHLRQIVRSRALGVSIAVLGGTTVLVLLIATGLFWFGVPALASVAAGAVPVSVEQRIGEIVAGDLGSGACTNRELTAAVAEIRQRLSAAAEENPYTFQIQVANRSEVNAFAAPGGYIVAFHGLVQRTASPEELAGVMAHEFQHVLQRHSMKGLIRQAGLAAVLSLLFGDTSGLVGVAGTLGHLSFSRGDEEEADREGMKLLSRAQIDTRAMVRVYEKLAEESADLPSGLSYLSTHPNMKGRADRLRDLQQTLPNAARPLQGGGWLEVRSKCRNRNR